VTPIPSALGPGSNRERSRFIVAHNRKRESIAAPTVCPASFVAFVTAASTPCSPLMSDSPRAARPYGSGMRPETATPPPSSYPLRFYQKYLSELRIGRCQFDPAVSQFGVGSDRGVRLSQRELSDRDRLIRCNQHADNSTPRSPTDGFRIPRRLREIARRAARAGLAAPDRTGARHPPGTRGRRRGSPRARTPAPRKPSFRRCAGALGGLSEGPSPRQARRVYGEHRRRPRWSFSGSAMLLPERRLNNRRRRTSSRQQSTNRADESMADP